MEASSASSAVAAAAALATSTSQRITNPIAIKPPWPLSKLNMLSLYASANPHPRNNFPFLPCCSTKPESTNTHNSSETDKNSTAESNLISKTQNPSTPVSDQISSVSSPPPSAKGLVFDLGIKNSWDSAEIGSPVIKRFLSDEEERWYMWYYGSCDGKSGSDSIGIAVSSNGIHWQRGNGQIQSSGDVGLVMNCGKDWWAFDTSCIRPCEVVIMSSAKVRASSAVYWLYYTGYSSEKADFLDDSLEFNLENPEKFFPENENSGIGKVFKSMPGLAISQDGRHWARIEGEHHSGALFDVGEEKEWDSLFIAAPQVVFHGSGDLRMYYHSFDAENGQFCVGIARSRDGMKWVKLGKIMGGGKTGAFDEFGVMNARVVKNREDGKYMMVYEGVDANGGRSIGLAVSPDGLKEWRRFHDEAILEKSGEDGWDDKGVGCPCLVQMDGAFDEWRLYYRGVGNGGRTGIGMAVSEGSDISRFKRWTGFHL